MDNLINNIHKKSNKNNPENNKNRDGINAYIVK